MYKVRLASRRIEKAIADLPPTARQRVIQALRGLREEPHPRGARKLGGKLSGSWRIRVGAYRILYDIYDDDRVVVITDVGQRKDIYRRR